jgi:LysR family cyn operon transcriptional activator
MISNLELYRAFYWTAKEGNLSRAAERLFITQPSVSHAIKQLEEELQLTLFHRTSRGVSLTKEGEMLHQHVEQAFNFLETAERKLAEFTDLIRGELRIGSSDSLCKHFLLPHLGSFHERHPHIRISLVHGTTPEIVKHLKEGRIDFGVVRLPVYDDQLHMLEVTSVQDCFVAGVKHKHLAEREIALQQLLDYPIILFSKNSSSRDFVSGFARQHGLEIVPEIELGSVDLLIEFAKHGLGISFVTKQFVQNELDRHILFEIKLQEQIPQRKVGIALLKKVPISAATNAFIQHLTVDK